MNTTTIVAILLAHYVGDWFLQVFFQKWMGKKNESWTHLLRHATTLMVPLVIVGAFFGGAAGVYWAAFNAAAHFFIDAASSRLTHRFYGQGRLDRFWLTIGTDQTLHLIILFVTWGWLK